MSPWPTLTSGKAGGGKPKPDMLAVVSSPKVHEELHNFQESVLLWPNTEQLGTQKLYFFIAGWFHVKSSETYYLTIDMFK